MSLPTTSPVLNGPGAPPPGQQSLEETPAPPGESRVSGLGLFAATVSFLLPILYSPSVSARYWLPRYAVTLVVAGVGFAFLLTKPVPSHKLATWAARGFLFVAALSTLVSGNPDLAVAGRWNQGTGLAFLAACVGAWAIGTRLGERDRRLLIAALVAAISINVATGIASMNFDLGRFGLERLFGRAMGLLGNPVHLGPLAVGGIALLLPWLRGAWWRPVVVAPFSAAVVLSGSPAALGLLIVPVAWAGRRFGWRPAFGLMVAIALGVLVAPILDRPPPRVVSQAGGSDQASVTRSEDVALSSTFQGRVLGPRLETWKAGAAAIAERPLLGYGPGMYGEATLPRRSLAVAQAYPNALFSDAHNFVVELATTTGILGFAALAVWLGAAAAQARGVLSVFALVIGLAHIYQPQFLATAIPALFALGASAGRLNRPSSRQRAIALTTGGVGSAFAAFVLVGGFLLNQARLDFDLRDAQMAAKFLAPWAEPHNRAALIQQFEFVTGDRSIAPAVRRSFVEATLREPLDPEIWWRLGDVSLSHRELPAARAAYRAALAIDRWSIGAHLGMSRLALAEGDVSEVRMWLNRAAAIDPSVADKFQVPPSLESTETRDSTPGIG